MKRFLKNLKKRTKALFYLHSRRASCQAPLLLQRIWPAPEGWRVETHPQNSPPLEAVCLQAHSRTASELPPIMQLWVNWFERQRSKSFKQSYSKSTNSQLCARAKSNTAPGYLHSTSCTYCCSSTLLQLIKLVLGIQILFPSQEMWGFFNIPGSWQVKFWKTYVKTSHSWLAVAGQQGAAAKVALCPVR